MSKINTPRRKDATPMAVTLRPVASGQKAAEREVDRFRRALGPFVVAAEATRMAMVFTNATQPGNPIIFANDSFLALTGFACDEVAGRSFKSLMSKMADPVSLARLEAQFEQHGTGTIEVSCRHKGGQPFQVAIQINPVHDKGGAVVQHCVSFVDLSGHLARASEERDALHALYQHTPDFIIMLDGPDHRFTFANDAYQRLIGQRDLLGRSVAEVLPEVVAQGFVALLDTVFRTGEPFNGKNIAVELACEDGATVELRYVDFIYQAIRDPEAAIIGVFCEGHEVTEQKRAAEQVQTLQAELIHLARVSAMGTMAATLAHELTQPLTTISNYAEVCHRLIDDKGPQATALVAAVQAMDDSAARAREIIRRLKHMTKRGKPMRQRFDLHDAVRGTIELTHIGACKGSSIVDTTIDGVVLDADRTQIQQVIMNLLKNACEAIPRSRTGRVTISAKKNGNRAIVSVADNGSGISAGVAATLFEWSDSTKAEGMGIGLSICRTIMTAHDGEIWLESSSAKGSCFCFSCPTAPAEVVRATRKITSQIAGR